MVSKIITEVITTLITKLFEFSGVPKMIKKHRENKRKKEIERELYESDDAAAIERLNRELFGS